MAPSRAALDKPLSVSLYGAGQVNTRVAQILEDRPGTVVHGPFARDERSRALGSAADVVVIATTSFLSEVGPDIEEALLHGSNVITTAEEGAYPHAYGAELGRRLDSLARRRRRTVVGLGLNPGFTFDALTLTAMGLTAEVPGVLVRRVVDLSGFGAAVLRRIGVGHSRTAFERGVAEGTITGHVGFPQSMRMVADAVGRTIDRIDSSIEPIFASAAIQGAAVPVGAGASAGFRQTYVAHADGQPWFEAQFVGHVRPQEVGLAPLDAIRFDSSPPLSLTIDPGINPQVGAPALVANSLRRVVSAPPGWLSVTDLPPAHPVVNRAERRPS